MHSPLIRVITTNVTMLRYLHMYSICLVIGQFHVLPFILIPDVHILASYLVYKVTGVGQLWLKGLKFLVVGIYLGRSVHPREAANQPQTIDIEARCIRICCVCALRKMLELRYVASNYASSGVSETLP